MKKYKINILGRTCVIATDKDESFMRKIEHEINDKLQNLRLSMPHADYLDICIIYLFLLSEQIDGLQKRVEKMKASSLQAKKILHSIREEILRELTTQDMQGKL
ncbi:MAG TPA: cell division protein ZapA [bacterium]|nr:cell division protein ZapA [bacterium]HOL36109.1 cell division protein ZapA [bacterium]